MQKGFNPIAHVEMNQYAAKTVETRSIYYYLKKVGRLNIYYDYLRGDINTSTTVGGSSSRGITDSNL